jgi:hypothetical protein
MTVVLDAGQRRRARIVATLSVRLGRAIGKPDDVNRREALDVAIEAITKSFVDQIKQESWFAAIETAVDREIARTRTEGQG